MDLAGVFQAVEDFPDLFVNGFPALFVVDATEVLGEVVAPIVVVSQLQLPGFVLRALFECPFPRPEAPCSIGVHLLFPSSELSCVLAVDGLPHCSAFGTWCMAKCFAAGLLEVLGLDGVVSRAQ